MEWVPKSTRVSLPTRAMAVQQEALSQTSTTLSVRIVHKRVKTVNECRQRALQTLIRPVVVLVPPKRATAHIMFPKPVTTARLPRLAAARDNVRHVYRVRLARANTTCIERATKAAHTKPVPRLFVKK